MLNLIRMNLFRMVHTRGVIVVFVLLMGFSVLSGSMSVYDSEEMAKEIEEQKTGAQQENPGLVIEENGEQIESVGITINTPIEEDGSLSDYIFIYCEELSSGILLLFILIGAVLFFRGDEKCGFLKNIAGQTKHRYNIFFSKLITVGIYTFVCMVCYMFVEYIVFNILIETDINFGVKHIPEALKVFALEYLIHMALISGLLLITELTKSTAAAVTIGILSVMGICSMLFSAIVQKFFHINFNVAKYYLTTSMSNVNIGMDGDIIKLALGVGITFFIIYNIANVYWFSHKDIV